MMRCRDAGVQQWLCNTVLQALTTTLGLPMHAMMLTRIACCSCCSSPALCAAIHTPLPFQAFSAAISALQHCPHNAKAWLRTAEACKAARRWQLAHLFYSFAFDELGATDDAARVRQQQGCFVCS
jgi:hypothetical protein